MIHIRAYRPEDIEAAGPPTHDIAGFTAYADHIKDYAKYLKMWGPAFTAVSDEEGVLGSAGIIRFLPWRCSAWVYIGEKALAHPFLIHRKVKRGLDMLMRENGIHRAESEVLATDSKAVAWILRLGFRFEGEMKNCGPNGETYERWAKCVHS